MGKKNKRSHDDPQLEPEPEQTTRIDGDYKKKKKRSHEDLEMEPERKMSLDVDAKKEKKKKSQELEPEQSKIEKEEKPNVEEKNNEDIPTVTIAIAGSIIHNTQSLELATRVLLLSLSLSPLFRCSVLVSIPLFHYYYTN